MCALSLTVLSYILFFFFFQAEDGIRDYKVTGVQTCALPISFGFRYIARTRKEDLTLAITHLERALALDPEIAEPYQWLAYAYTRAYRFDEGRQAADRAVVLDPDSTFSYYFAGLNRVVRGAVEHRWELYPEAAPLLVRAGENGRGHV